MRLEIRLLSSIFHEHEVEVAWKTFFMSLFKFGIVMLLGVGFMSDKEINLGLVRISLN